jgi:hypothetical protein
MARRIVLFTRDAGLTVALRGLLSAEDRVVQFDSPDGRLDTLDPVADTIVLDLPADLRRGAYRSVREWFSGRLVILLAPGEVDKSFDSDKGCRTLFRPFQLDDLIRELAVPPGRIRSVISGAARRESAAPPRGPGRVPPMPPSRLGPADRRPIPTAPPPGPVDRTAWPDARMGGSRRWPKVGEDPRPDAAPPAGGAGAGSEPPAGGAGAGSVPPAGGAGAGSVPPAGGGAGREPPPGDQEAGAAPPAPRPGDGRGADPVAPPDLQGLQPPGRGGAPGPGERMPPLASRARAAFPDGMDLPSRTASPGRPEKAPPADPGGMDVPSRTASPGRPEKAPPADPEQPPLVFDWFAPRGRRLDEAGADRPAAGHDDPPANGTGQAPPAPAPQSQAALREADSRQAREEEFRRRLDALRSPDRDRRADPRRPAPAGHPAGPAPEPPQDLERAGMPDTAQRPAPPPGGEPAVPAGEEPDHGEQAQPGDGDRPRMVDFRPGSAGQAGADRERQPGPARPAAPTATTPTAPAPGADWAVQPAAASARRAAAGQPGERVRAPAPQSWAGPAPAAWRVLLAVGAGGLALLVSGLFSARSPELGAGEAAVAQVARSVAGGTGIAWRGQPVLDQPPLALLAHAGWLAATGKADADLIQVVHQARLASSGFRGLAVGLLVLLVLALTGRRQDPLLRFALGGAAGVLAALDPLLAGAGRAVTLEAAGLAAGLATLWLAWLLHERRAAFVPAVGLASGVALLADGRSLVLLLVPLGFALLIHPRVDGLVGRAAAALTVGVGFWAAFAAWVARAPGAAGLDERLGRLAALAHLTAADRPLPASRPLDLALPRDLATVAVLVLAVPALVAVWRRGERAGLFLVTWNVVVLSAMVLLAGMGALDESWLVYAVPGAVAAVVLGLGAVRDLAASRGTWARRAAAVAATVAVLALVVLGGYGWDGRYGRADDALAQMGTLVARTPACSALNAGNPADPDLFAVGQRRVTEFTSGGAALASGVRYFLLRGGDVASPRGVAGGSLPGWLRDNGRQVASFPSPSHGSVQLWEVQQPPGSRVADLLRVNGGAFENVAGSACGGFAVVDAGGARFWSGYQGVGGKAVVGRPLSRPWQVGGQTMQAFDTMVLGSVPDPQGGPPLARPVALLTRLSRQDPDLLDVTGMPKATTLPPRSIQERRQLLTEPRIARYYLRTRQPAAARPADWRLAEVRFGAPVSPPRRVAGGAVRQGFENAVIEVDRSGAVRLAPLGALAAKAGVVPPDALRRDPVPGLPPPGGRYLRPGPVADVDLAVHLGAALGLWLLLAVALALRARFDRPHSPVPAAPRLAPSTGDPEPLPTRRRDRASAPTGEERAT